MAVMDTKDMFEIMSKFDRPPGFVPDSSLGHAHYVESLINEETKRYDPTREWRELGDAIHITAETIEIVARQHPSNASRFRDAIGKIWTSLTSADVIQNTEIAIDIGQHHIEEMPVPDLDQLKPLIDAAAQQNNRNMFYRLIEELGSVTRLMRDIIQIAESSYARHTGARHTGERLKSLRSRLGDEYLRPSASHAKEAALMARDIFGSDMTTSLVDVYWTQKVGKIFFGRYERTTARGDLEEAISVARDVVGATPAERYDYAEQLNTLGDRLYVRYRIDGTMGDLLEAITLAQDALTSTPDDRADRANYLNTLGRRLHAKYLRSGQPEELEEAIHIAREAVVRTAEDDPKRPEHLDDLGAWLSSRYSHIQMLADLEEAVNVAWLAFKISPGDDPAYGTRLSRLGDQLAKRYSRTRSPVDLETAICLAREALRLAPGYHADRPDRLDALGNRLHDRYTVRREPGDLYEAIELGWGAVKATPEDHPDIARRWNNLGVLYRHQFFLTRMIPDLREAIEATEEGLQLTPEDHPSRSALLMNLGDLFKVRHTALSNPEDLANAKRNLHLALAHESSPTAQRLVAGRLLLSSLDVSENSREAYQAVENIMELLPLLFLPSLHNHDKEHLLPQIAGLASDSAAIALLDGRSHTTAINLLELGRGVLTGSLYDLRSDLHELHSVHPQLASSLVELRLQLQNSYSEREMVAAGIASDNLKTRTDKRHEASRQITLLLEEIRKQPTFERFLLPPSQEEMVGVASKGPIVIINVSSYRCDAFIVDSSGIQLLELPELSLPDILIRAKDLDSRANLEWMWDCFIEVILDKLGFTDLPVASPWPHVWWIPTGPLVKFPLHAAGYHFSESKGMTVLDRVISSYGSSIKAMWYGRKQWNATPLLGQSKVVLVAMQHTRGARQLYHAENEIRMVEDICRPAVGDCVHPARVHKEVTAAIDTCTIFHFAGHGNSKVKSPLNSLLLLKDWEERPFTVGDVMDMEIGTQQRFLAYLSACGTGRVQESSAMDESIHLIGAFQLAGFRNVVGTLWEVDDELCVSMARLFYLFVAENGLHVESVSNGLAFASRRLRDRWVREQTTSLPYVGEGGVRTIGTADDGEVDSPLWAPYIHFGV